MKTAAWVLSGAGLVPIVGLSAALIVSDDARLGQALLAYSAVILSFLGGIQWGVALFSQGDDRRATWLLGISIFPSLIAWSCLLQPGLSSGLGVVLAGFLSALLVDRYLTRMEILPVWFWGLRWRITSVVVVSLGLTLLLH